MCTIFHENEVKFIRILYLSIIWGLSQPISTPWNPTRFNMNIVFHPIIENKSSRHYTNEDKNEDKNKNNNNNRNTLSKMHPDLLKIFIWETWH